MWTFVGALLAFLAVSAGAFGAHLLRDTLTEELATVFETAARYHMYHALALIAVGLLIRQAPSRIAHLAGACFLLGTLIFSGSLYALALSGFRPLGMITPVGGVLQLAGWFLLMLAALARPRTRSE